MVVAFGRSQQSEILEEDSCLNQENGWSIKDLPYVEILAQS